MNIVLRHELKLCFFGGHQRAFSYSGDEEYVDVLGPVWAWVLLTIASGKYIFIPRTSPPKMLPLRLSLVFRALGPAQQTHAWRPWDLTLPAFVLVFDQEETGSEWPLTMRPTFSWPTPRMTWRIGWRPYAGSSGPPSVEVSMSQYVCVHVFSLCWWLGNTLQ